MTKTIKKQNILISLLLIFSLSLSALIFYSAAPIRAFAGMDWSGNYFCFFGASDFLDDEGADCFYFQNGYFEISFESWDTFYEPYVELSGYDFVGWTEDYDFLYNLSNSLGLSYCVVDYASLASIDFYDFSDTFERPIDVQAVFVPSETVLPSVMVTFDKQGGLGGSDGVTVTFDSSMPSATAPTKTGYTFGGYYMQAGGGGMQYYTNTMVSANTSFFTAPITLYAQWTANIYNVTFDKQGGTGGSDGLTVTYGAILPVITMPTKTGYLFGGYYTAENGDGTYYNFWGFGPVTLWVTAGDTILYASWVEDAIVSIPTSPSEVFYFCFLGVDGYNYDGFDYMFYSNDPTAMDAILAIRDTTVIREGYTFVGWTSINYFGVIDRSDVPYVQKLNFAEVFTRDIVVSSVWVADEPEPVDPSDSDSSGSPAFFNIFSLQNLSKAAGVLLLVTFVAYVFKFFCRVKNKGRGGHSFKKRY
jgi:uncharacterized repeat protein (TIGR02543 family)